MILEQLEALNPRKSVESLEKLLLQKRRLLKRSLRQSQRKTRAWVKSQYYISHAYRDCRNAFYLNQDIVLASIFVIAVISFSATTTIANAIYTFMLAASVMSSVSGLNLAILVLLAFGTLAVLGIWTSALLQNLLSISLMEGLTHKRNRSLLLTLRKALQYSPRTALAWSALVVLAAGPALASIFAAMLIVMVANIDPATALPYMIGLCMVGIVWVFTVVGNYSLLPYVMLFEKETGWVEAFARSRKLVLRSGRLFIISLYLTLLACFVSLFGIAIIIEKATHLNSTITFLLLSTFALSASNGLLTAFYRKRKLARK